MRWHGWGRRRDASVTGTRVASPYLPSATLVCAALTHPTVRKYATEVIEPKVREMDESEVMDKVCGGKTQ